MKTVKQEEPVSRSRFIDCPNCKTRSLKLKRIVQVGRCKSCHESYKIVIVFVKTGKKAGPEAKPGLGTTEAKSESTLPSWQMPSDSFLFGSLGETSSTFSDLSFDFGETDRENKEPQTGSEY